MFPTPVLEARLRVGLIYGEDHLRWQTEVLNPENRELLAMRSKWHAPVESIELELARALRYLVEDLLNLANPDPF